MLASTCALLAESGAFIRNIAEMGVIFIMFALGFEESTDDFIAGVKRSWGIALVVVLLAHFFGFQPAAGAYMAGLIVREEHFQLERGKSGSRRRLANVNVYEETKQIVDDAAFRWVGPAFFVDLGAKMLFDRDLLVQVLP